MASFAYGEAMLLVVQQSLDLLNDTIKVALSDTTHVPDKDDAFVDDGGADDLIDGELNGTGYAGGFGNAGRKALASKALVYDTANDRVEFDAADLTWTAIDAGTIAQATLLKEVTSDADSPVIVNIDVADTVSNGGDVSLAWNAEGILQLSV